MEDIVYILETSTPQRVRKVTIATASDEEPIQPADAATPGEPTTEKGDSDADFKIKLDFDFDFDLNVNELNIGSDTNLAEMLSNANLSEMVIDANLDEVLQQGSITKDNLFLKDITTMTAVATEDAMVPKENSIVNDILFKALPIAFVIYVLLRLY